MVIYSRKLWASPGKAEKPSLNVFPQREETQQLIQSFRNTDRDFCETVRHGLIGGVSKITSGHCQNVFSPQLTPFVCVVPKVTHLNNLQWFTAEHNLPDQHFLNPVVDLWLFSLQAMDIALLFWFNCLHEIDVQNKKFYKKCIKLHFYIKFHWGQSVWGQMLSAASAPPHSSPANLLLLPLKATPASCNSTSMFFIVWG